MFDTLGEVYKPVQGVDGSDTVEKSKAAHKKQERGMANTEAENRNVHVPTTCYNVFLGALVVNAIHQFWNLDGI